ncbi:MAG: glycoside hydrolase family 95 protein [Prevotella sp.]
MRNHLLIILGLLFFANNIQTTAQQLPMKLWYDKPATFFEEALPLGNGKLGAVVYGQPEDNLLYLNDLTFWTGQPVDSTLDRHAHEWIPAIREALFKEDYKTADSLQLKVQGPNSQYYQPLATLHIIDSRGERATDYRRELDIDSALCRDSYMLDGVQITREYLASNPDHAIVIHFQASKPGAINCQIKLSAQVPHHFSASTDRLFMEGHAYGSPENSVHFCTILHAQVKDGQAVASDSTLTLSNATQATLYIVNQTSFNGFDKHPVRQAAPYKENAERNLTQALLSDYQQIRQRHVNDYQQYFNRLKLFLGGSVVDNHRTTEQQLKDYTDQGGHNPYLETLYMQYGRYLLISCSRTHAVPANLQGLWANRLFSQWRSNYTININLEENYWPAEVSNLSEMTEPLISFMQALSVTGKHVAKNYYNIERGWCSSHNSDLWAMANPVGEKNESPEWSNWNLGGAWLTQNLWEHYRFTRDKKFLKNTAYPLLKGASEFMLDWLIENPKTPGELITAPSTSPENEYVTPKGYHGTTCYGGTADLAIIRELFINTGEAILAQGNKFAKRSSLLTEINKALPRLHPYIIGHMGDINEWYYDWDDYDFQHRHQSHLIGLYPGHHITLTETPLLAKAAARALEIKGDQTTGWSTGWRINLWARLHNSQQAYHIYQKLLTYVSPDNYQGKDKRRSGGTYPNLFDAHPPFQIDGNLGGTAGVLEMLMQSTDTELDLLPALPSAWKDGEIHGIRARGGYELSMKWEDGKVVWASLKPCTKNFVKHLNVHFNGTKRLVLLKKHKAVMIQ